MTATPACGTEMFARRIAIMGADPANASTADPVPPEWMTSDPAVQPYQPWAADVMLLAGVAEGRPWLYLACRACGWFAGFASQHVPADLARYAAEHEAGCEAIAVRSEVSARAE